MHNQLDEDINDYIKSYNAMYSFFISRATIDTTLIIMKLPISEYPPIKKEVFWTRCLMYGQLEAIDDFITLCSHLDILIDAKIRWVSSDLNGYREVFKQVRISRLLGKSEVKEMADNPRKTYMYGSTYQDLVKSMKYGKEEHHIEYKHILIPRHAIGSKELIWKLRLFTGEQEAIDDFLEHLRTIGYSISTTMGSKLQGPDDYDVYLSITATRK